MAHKELVSWSIFVCATHLLNLWSKGAFFHLLGFQFFCFLRYFLFYSVPVLIKSVRHLTLYGLHHIGREPKVLQKVLPGVSKLDIFFSKVVVFGLGSGLFVLLDHLDVLGDEVPRA